MRLLRCLIYATLIGFGALALLANELAKRMTGRDDAGGSLVMIGLLLLAAGGVGVLYEWAFWQRARRLRAQEARYLAESTARSTLEDQYR